MRNSNDSDLVDEQPEFLKRKKTTVEKSKQEEEKSPTFEEQLEETNEAWAEIDKLESPYWDKRLRLARLMATTRKLCERKGHKWSRKNAQIWFKKPDGNPRSWTEIKALAAIGAAKNPEMAMREHRDKVNERVRKCRTIKQTSGESIGPLRNGSGEGQQSEGIEKKYKPEAGQLKKRCAHRKIAEELDDAAYGHDESKNADPILEAKKLVEAMNEDEREAFFREVISLLSKHFFRWLKDRGVHVQEIEKSTHPVRRIAAGS